MNKKKQLWLMTVVAILSLGSGAFTAYRLAQSETEISDLTLANLEAMGASLGDLELDPFWPPPIPEGENRNAWVPDHFNPGHRFCAGSGHECRAAVDNN